MTRKPVTLSNLIYALQILNKYGDPSYPTNCEHDILRVFIDRELVSSEDREELEALRFYVDDDLGGFYSTAYGSN